MQLDFLETIEGTSGEKLTSAVLKYLIVNSPIFRDCLIARIAASVPPGHAPSFRSGLFCQTEYPTDGREGFIDILLCDGEAGQISFVVAFEVKLWAAFTDNQPAKYVGTLLRMVKDANLSRLLIIVLAPDERIPRVKEHLQLQATLKVPCVWGWSKIDEDLEKVAKDESPYLALVAKWLLRFLKVRIGEKTLQGTPDAYVGQNVVLGNEYHYEFLGKLKSCLPSPGRVIMRDGREKYVGFYCECIALERSEHSAAKVWIGFVPNPNDGIIVFGIDTGLPYLPQQDTLCLWNREFKVIPFAAELKTAMQWQERLTPELKAIQIRRTQITLDDAMP